MRKIAVWLRRCRAGAIWLAVFSCVLWYLVATNPYYPETRLKLTGSVSQASNLEVMYDFGDGFKSFQVESLGIRPEGAQGVFSAALDIPAVRVQRIKIVLPAAPTKLSEMRGWFVYQGEERNLSSKVTRDGSAIIFSCKGQRSPQFSRFGFVIHSILAALVAWLCVGALSLRQRLAAPSWRAVAKRVCVEERRYRFWIMLVVASAVHSLWLLAYWPASMTNDSWASLHEIQTLTITDWHPYPYTLWLLGLMHLFHSIAVVGVVQIVTTAAVVSGVLYFVWQRGVPTWIVTVSYLLFIFSIPVGLFNTIVWKDIPFSISILMLSFLLFKAQYVKDAEKRYLRIEGWHWVFFGALCVVLCHFRHNGIIFYGIIPLLAIGRISSTDMKRLGITLAVVFVSFNYLFPYLLNIRRTTASPQQEYRTALAIMTHFNYYSKDRQSDKRIIEEATKMSWAEITSLYPRNWFDAWDKSEIQRKQFLPGNGHTDEYTKAFVARLAMENIPIVLASRTYEFLHSIGIDQSAYDATTDYYQNPLQLHGSNLVPPGRLLFKVPIESSPISSGLRETMMDIAQWSMKYDGLLSRQVLIWNLAVFLVVFCAIIFFEGGLSAIGLFTLPSLASAGAVFLAGAGESWRYFYYVYLAGVVVVPLYVCYWRNIRNRRA